MSLFVFGEERVNLRFALAEPVGSPGFERHPAHHDHALPLPRGAPRRRAFAVVRRAALLLPSFDEAGFLFIRELRCVDGDRERTFDDFVEEGAKEGAAAELR